MSGSRNHLAWLISAAYFSLLLAVCAYVVKVESSPRHVDTFRYQIECVLEDLGVISFDPSRHVNG